MGMTLEVVFVVFKQETMAVEYNCIISHCSLGAPKQAYGIYLGGIPASKLLCEISLISQHDSCLKVYTHEGVHR